MNLRTEAVALLASTVVNSSGFTGAVDVTRFEQTTLFVAATSFSGTTPAIVVAPQYSYDGVTWHDCQTSDSTSSLSSNTLTTISLNNKAISWLRCAYTLTGTTPQCTLKLDLVGSVYT